MQCSLVVASALSPRAPSAWVKGGGGGVIQRGYHSPAALPAVSPAHTSPVAPPRGQATTLKRNGSDFSATILGSLFRAGHISIWTDVDGVYSADPRKVGGGSLC